MSELIKINYDGDRQTTSARSLHDYLEIGTEYAKWFSRMTEYGFTDNADFRLIVKNDENSFGRPSTDHEITIEMAKEICMIQRTEKGKQARQYFIELEKQWNSPDAVMARALKMADRKIISLQEERQKLQIQLEQQQPKVLFADAVNVSNTCILIGDLAKIVKQNGYDIGEIRLFKWLRENGYLIKSGNEKNSPTQYSMDLKLFEIKETVINKPDGTIKVSKTSMVTSKGQIYFVNKFLKLKNELGA